MAVGFGTACPKVRKPANAKRGITARERGRRQAKKLAAEIAIKAMVMNRDGHVCRVCGRRAESVHEITSKGAGGKVSLENSISVCGLLVGVEPSCHTYLQSGAIDVCGEHGDGLVDANRPLVFVPFSLAARKWIEAAQ